MQMLVFRTLGKRRLLSLTSLPRGETRVMEQVAEIPFSPACWCSVPQTSLATGAEPDFATAA